MRARDYSPVVGQFLSNDPVGLVAGDTNIRRYLANDPVSAVDPSGCGQFVYFVSRDLSPWPNAMAMTAAVGSSALGFGAFAPFHEGYKLDDGRVISIGGGWQDKSGSHTGYHFENFQTINSNDFVALDETEYDDESVLKGFQSYGQDIASGKRDWFLTPIWGNQYNCQSICNDIKFGFAKKKRPEPETSPVSSRGIINKTSDDPNSLVGPAGVGTPNYIQDAGTWPYTINFENDGSAAAQDVVVTEQLDPNLSWSTFQLGSFGWGQANVTVPAGLLEYQTTVSYQNTDGTPLNVQVTLNFDVQTGLLTVTYTSLDPATGQAPMGVFDGFLPPDDSSHVGEGFVQYSIQPKTGLATGATISQQASIVFDINAALATNTAANTIDAAPPSSTVNPLPADGPPRFLVSWSGHDDAGGSGLASYDVYVSANGGPWQLWQDKTAQTSAIYNGQLGNKYSFYAIAHDNVGNTEAKPAVAEAVTQAALYQATLSEPAGTTTPAVEKISTLLGSHYGDPDGSKRTKPGIAVIGTNGNGAWQYFNGSGWVNIAAVAQTRALLLPRADALRFLPSGLAAGTVELLFVAWDGSLGSAGQYANASVVGGGTPFSIGAGMFNVTLTAVTQAPVWLASTATLTPVLPGTATLVGQTVQQAFASVFSGTNGQAAGIAVTGTTGTTSGTWEYNLYQSGTQTYAGWKSFPTPSAAAAVLLSGLDMIAFVPKSGFIGAVTLTARAWDQSTGIDGGTANLNKTGTGGKTAFSARPLTATIHVNTAPTQNASSVPLPAIAENVPSAAVSVATLLADAHASKNALGLAITAATGPGTWQYQLSGGSWQAVPANLALLLPRSASVHFVPAPDASGSATLTWVAWDQTAGTAGAGGFTIPGSGGAFAFSINSATATLTITASHRAPAWSGTGAALTPVLPGTTQPAGDSVASIFGAYFQDGTISANPGIAITALTGTSNGAWQYSANGTNWTPVGSVSVTKALLLPAVYRLRFVPRSGFIGAVTLSAYAWDGSVGAAAATFNLNGKTGGTGPFSSTPLSAVCLVNTSPTLAP
jgi:uncharacterized repeat protein (TIGR01451 family)